MEKSQREEIKEKLDTYVQEKLGLTLEEGYFLFKSLANDYERTIMDEDALDIFDDEEQLEDADNELPAEEEIDDDEEIGNAVEEVETDDADDLYPPGEQPIDDIEDEPRREIKKTLPEKKEVKKNIINVITRKPLKKKKKAPQGLSN